MIFFNTGSEGGERAQLCISFHHCGFTELNSLAWDPLQCGLGTSRTSSPNLMQQPLEDSAEISTVVCDVSFLRRAAAFWMEKFDCAAGGAVMMGWEK